MTIVNYFQIRYMFVAEIFCKVGFTSGYACMVVNALTLWLMASDRHDCVVRPFNRRLTTRNVKILIGVTWTSGFTTAVLIGISIRNEPSVCIAFYPYSNSIIEYGGLFEAILAVVGQFDKITILIVVISFFRILKAFRSSAVNPSNSAHQRREKKLTWLTYKICGVFLLLRIPVIISHVTTSGKLQDTTGRTARLVSYAMVHLMYVANPILHRKMLTVRLLTQLRTADCRQLTQFKTAGAGEPVQLAVAGTVENHNASAES